VSLFSPVERCLICESSSLKRLHWERIEVGNSLNDPDWADFLRPYDRYAFALNRCQKCDFLQPDTLPTNPTYFEGIYDQKWSEEWMQNDFENTYKDFIFSKILKELGKRLQPTQRRLIDVGAHVGKMVWMAKQAGWQASGIDFNSQTAVFAARKTGCPIHRMDAQSLSETGQRYDAVVLTDVLEHIPRPVEVLKQLRGLLDRDGVIAVKVPNGLSQRRKQLFQAVFNLHTDVGIATTMVHVNHFSPRSLRIALEKAGFSKVTIGVAPSEFVGRTGYSIRPSVLARLACYYAAKIIPGGVSSPLTMNLQAYAHVANQD
jgi:2-polyprenyl-3-methyl-5-hydroxy-6-metoxy-1,4-benzoquinol methylase